MEDESQSSPQQGEDRSLKTAESLRALREQADKTLGNHRQSVSEIEVRLNSQLELIAEALSRERLAEEETHVASAEQAKAFEEVRKTLAEKEAEIEEVLEKLAAQSLEFEAQIAERDDELEQLLELNDEDNQQHESLHQELAEAREALENLQNAECSECQRVLDELTQAGTQLSQLDEQFQTLRAQHQSLQAELEETRHTAQTIHEQNEQTQASLEAAEQHIQELSNLEHADEQLEQTRRKFELALADVHKLKRENADLREELQSRPEADHQESPELVSVRSERDALADRVAELESTADQAPDIDSQQELDDLQRRFELAVDDVRQLKQENSDLIQKLEASLSGSPPPAGDDAQDWQSQKARLMALLDAEDQGVIDEARREERAKIEGTISITDRVVAERDTLLAQREAEIAELRSQLETRPAGQDLDSLREEIAAEILNDDEAVQAECAKLKEKQITLDGKLREAELEISVQRATLAREQAALEEKLALLPTLESAEAEGTPGKPRRRWLSALGIKDEEEN